MELCRVEKMSVHKVRMNIWCNAKCHDLYWLWFNYELQITFFSSIPVTIILFLLALFYTCYNWCDYNKGLFLPQAHYKDALQDGLQDAHLGLDSPESDGRDCIMESPDSSCDSRCSKSATCSVSWAKQTPADAIASNSFVLLFLKRFLYHSLTVRPNAR